MSKYKVSTLYTVRVYDIVEADSVAEAHEKADRGLYLCGNCTKHIQVTSIYNDLMVQEIDND